MTMTSSSPTALRADTRSGKSFISGPWKLQIYRWQKIMDRSFYSPLYLTQALANQDIADLDIALVSTECNKSPRNQSAIQLARCYLVRHEFIPKELPGITCRSIDVNFEGGKAAECAVQIVAEMASIRDNATVAFRSGERFVEMLDPLNLSVAPERRRLEPRGVYLIHRRIGRYRLGRRRASGA